ncbi:MAG TPA: hypothetical protein VNQ73_12355 [Ilumatobacter sp.]|nr:hypothetical protein [Ilumatobacter sp.]
MMVLLDLAPLGAAVFAVPQFVPQLRRALRSGDVAGVSWLWAALTSAGNAAWFVYFALSGYWLALVPAVSASSMAGLLAMSIGRARCPDRRSVALVIGWASLLVGSFGLAGRVGLGTLLSVAFVVQVVPAIWTAYRTQVPTGIAVGTWLLVLGELSCWGAYGLHRGDGRLAVMGVSGSIAAVLMISRAVTARRSPIAVGPVGSAAGKLTAAGETGG